MYHLYVKKKILTGIKEIEQGKVIPHDQVMKNAKKRLEKWLEEWSPTAENDMIEII